MSPVILIAAMTIPCVDTGWRRLDNGGLEYVIQIEPELLESLRSGHDITSEIPPALRGVRSYRITVGTGPLPHEQPALPSGSAYRPADQSAATVAPVPEPGDFGEAVAPVDRRQQAASAPLVSQPAGSQPVEAPSQQELPSATELAQPEHVMRGMPPTAWPAAAEEPPQTFSETWQAQNIEPIEMPEEPRGVVTKKSAPGSSGDPQQEPGGVSQSTDVPWLPLTVTVVCLFASVGANVYLGWTLWEMRQRFFRLLRESAAGATSRRRLAHG